ncbi:MAG TPA: DUF177 domain-containing protein [Terriglobia bacterium]|nr:DUF177 domain-containing protein [Terriglobia bacterium]
MHQNDNIEFSRIITLDKISLTESSRHIEADPAERQALALRFGLVALDSLKADLRFKRTGAGVIRVWGHLQAAATQSCVISLAPVPAELAVDFEMFFTEDVGASDAELTLEYDQDDPPEPVTGGQIDLGEVVAEQLGLNLDPYPRAPGARLPGDWVAAAVDSSDQVPKRNPFEALASLKTSKDKG